MDFAIILIDGREFRLYRTTGISRFLEGFIDALAEAAFARKIILAVFNSEAVPAKLKDRRNIKLVEIPNQFFSSERFESAIM